MSKKPVQRCSQLITTFGPGAMVDLPTRSVVIGGLERWHMRADTCQVIHEPMLVRRLEHWLRQAGHLESGKPLRLLTPPVADSLTGTDEPGVDVTVFPTWFVCDRVETILIKGQKRHARRLIKWSDLDPRSGRRKFLHDDGRKDDVSPLRFVGACEEGHLQDIQWRRLLHGTASCREPMWLTESGTSANIADLDMLCSCGAEFSMREAFRPGRLGVCEGQRPWLSENVQEECSKNLRFLTRSATHTYFPNVDKMISLPVSEDALTRVVEQHRHDLEQADNVNDIAGARKFNSALRMDIEGYSDEAVFERLQDVRRQGRADAGRNPRLREFDLLSSGRPEIGTNEPDARLFAETLPRDAWDDGTGRDLGVIRSVVVVHRLREVLCLYSFTRLQPAETHSNDDEEDIDLAVSGAPLSLNADWLPAIEQRGEGIFLHFDADRIASWQESPTVKQRIDVLAGSFANHRRRYQGTTEHWRGGSYVLLHSLAHALINEITLDCGYPASSLKERIYDFPANAVEPGRHGILLYTASTGAEGTLGGLVDTATRIASIIDRALKELLICSNDPVCADHEPDSVLDDRALLGAACHGCLLISETSCERRNLFLDRTLLVPTIANDGCAVWK
ncbi:MAG: DUF1998 domain-containing protein [Alphaproteobacteria bacterium]|jgi:hypothetical protein|nr:DUF1998 domain-containing protein [Alphaproteobacteria bacterium]